MVLFNLQIAPKLIILTETLVSTKHLGGYYQSKQLGKSY